MFFKFLKRLESIEDFKQYLLSFELIRELKNDFTIASYFFRHAYYAVAVVPFFIYHCYLDRKSLIYEYRFLLCRKFVLMMVPVPKYRFFLKDLWIVLGVFLFHYSYYAFSYGFRRRTTRELDVERPLIIFGELYFPIWPHKEQFDSLDASLHASVDPTIIMFVSVPTLVFFFSYYEDLKPAIYRQIEFFIRLFSFLLGKFLMKLWWWLFFFDFFFYAHFDWLRFEPFRDFMNPSHDYFNLFHDDYYFFEDNEDAAYMLMIKIESAAKWFGIHISISQRPKFWIRMATLLLGIFLFYNLLMRIYTDIRFYHMKSLDHYSEQDKRILIPYYNYNKPGFKLIAFYIFHRVFNFFFLIISIPLFILLGIPCLYIKKFIEDIKDLKRYYNYNWTKRQSMLSTFENNFFNSNNSSRGYFIKIYDSFVKKFNIERRLINQTFFYMLALGVLTIFFIIPYPYKEIPMTFIFDRYHVLSWNYLSRFGAEALVSIKESLPKGNSAFTNKNDQLLFLFEQGLDNTSQQKIIELSFKRLSIVDTPRFWGGLLFIIGFIGLVYSFRNIIIIFISIEVMLFGFLLILTSISVKFNDVSGIIFAFCILALAGSESALGLAMLVNFYTLNRETSVKTMSKLKF